MSVQFIKTGIFFLLAGMILGLVMHHQHSRELLPLHAHITLAGGFLMMIFGLIYKTFRAADRSKLAAWHFWLYTIPGLVLFAQAAIFAMMGRTFDDTQQHAKLIVPVLVSMLVLSLALFAINVFKNAEKEA